VTLIEAVTAILDRILLKPLYCLSAEAVDEKFVDPYSKEAWKEALQVRRCTPCTRGNTKIATVIQRTLKDESRGLTGPCHSKGFDRCRTPLLRSRT
jgi:hypothetical protein